MLRGSQALLDRLAALALMASAAPALRGCFSGWAFEHIVVPLYGDTMVRDMCTAGHVHVYVRPQ